MNCYTIPAGVSFLPRLAEWIIKEYGASAEALPRLLVLLPNRRACRSLQEAFLEAAGGKALLLPRLRPIGEVQDSDFGLFGTSEAVSPAISPVRRHLLLTKLVMEFEKTRAGRSYDAAQAAELATQLAQLLDDVARARLSFDALKDLVPEALAEHWQETLHFLRIVSHFWPRILESENALDPVMHRNLIMMATTNALAKNPPAHPIIAAGSTGSQPTTAALLSVIARLEQGRVVLPGLDTHMRESEWERVGATHPQFMLRQLLERMECARAQVRLLGEGMRPERVACLRAVFQPAEITAQWRTSIPLLEKSLQGLRMIEADTALDEARCIAVALRESLEIPGKTAALITPDRELARMVAAQMQRFEVNVDDSAGRRLSDTPAGYFLRLAAEMVASAAAPAALLAFMRHPLAACGMDTAECRRLSRVIEVPLLRGIRKSPGLEALRDGAKASKYLAPTVGHVLQEMIAHSKKLTLLFRQDSASLRALLEAHLAFVEWAATTDKMTGAERLWGGDAGAHLTEFLAGLLQHADALPVIDPASYGAFFESLLAGESYWPRYGQHPRLAILSPIEARLQQFDLVVLGGLNEGTWPALPATDAWMSRPMRQDFGLPAGEEAIGQSAHDVYLLCAAPQVLLTRARKSEGTPTVASRWLVRLTTFIGGLDKSWLHKIDVSARYAQARAQLDAPRDMPELVPPAPVPPLAARPRKLRVTAIDDWLRDPYMVYAKYILKLNALDALDQELAAADFGTVIHGALERFSQKFPGALPNDAYAELMMCGQEAFAPFIDRPAVAALWWPRFETIAMWLLEQEVLRRDTLTQLFSELKGEWTLEVDGKSFTLSTRIDRLEIVRDNKVIIADYKTGTLPKSKDIELGLANQLLLEALIATYGALDPAPDALGAIAGLEYWKLSGNYESCKITPVKLKNGDVSVWLEEARQRLINLIRRYDDPASAYAAQAVSSRYNDYEHLIRRQEWRDI